VKAERAHSHYMRLALALARRGYGATSPNPLVGAVLAKGGRIIGRGWHRRAGEPHAEIEALRAAQRGRHNTRGATLYVTLEPCSTQGRTPPCTDAIIAARIHSVVVGATDPNPRHRGRGFEILQRAGLKVARGVLSQECERLNETFNHWIVHHTPFVIVKAAMTLDGKIATAAGESKWITGKAARAYGMHLRRGADAVLVGVNTILADDPSLTIRDLGHPSSLWRNLPTRMTQTSDAAPGNHPLRRIVLDSYARTPVAAKIVTDPQAALTTIIVSKFAPNARVKALAARVRILVAPVANQVLGANPTSASLSKKKAKKGAESLLRLDLDWILKTLGAENVTNLLVEGGGEVNASFLMQGLAQRIAFFYAPKILGGRDARTPVAGEGVSQLCEAVKIIEPEWFKLGADWLLTARV